VLASVSGSQIGHGSAGYDRPRRAVGDGNWPAYRPAVAQGPAAAVSALVERVKKTVPTAVALRVDQDLVSVSDIAQRIGRTRESARLLVDAKRGPGNFPPPIGVVGDGIRVWPWSVVLEWSDKVLGVDLGENGVPPLTAAVLDVGFATRRSPELATALGRGWLTP
jgi:hypothetical protein